MHGCNKVTTGEHTKLINHKKDLNSKNLSIIGPTFLNNFKNQNLLGTITHFPNLEFDVLNKSPLSKT